MLSKEALRAQHRGEEAISEYETALALKRNFVVASRISLWPARPPSGW
jgi:hypothetical protein